MGKAGLMVYFVCTSRKVELMEVSNKNVLNPAGNANTVAAKLIMVGLSTLKPTDTHSRSSKVNENKQGILLTRKTNT